MNDPKRFLVHRWTLMQVDYATPIKLAKVFRDRYGVTPDFDSTITGAHFANASSRSVVTDQRSRAKLTTDLAAQVLSLISSMYRTQAHLADDSFSLPPMSQRAPRRDDEELVEIWPPVSSTSRDAIVAEYVSAAGWFAAPGPGSDTYVPTADPNDAFVFDSLDEAEAFLAAIGDSRFVLRYLSSVRAELEQRESALFDGY